jgi:putrescine transport system ATP-binding protein
MSAAISLRPENIHLAKQCPNVDVNIFAGFVREIAYFGSYSSYVVETVMTNATTQSASQIERIRITQSNNFRQDSSPIEKDDSVYFWWDAVAPVVLTQ